MYSMRQGFFWWEVDFTYYTLRAAEQLGLIWDVRKPSSHALAAPNTLPALEAPPA
jgi:stearoyl-CoA desaturase (delta-9 desaturase)